jgi:hypothetical protein
VASLLALRTNDNNNNETSYNVSTTRIYAKVEWKGGGGRPSDNTYPISRLTAWIQKPGSGETMSMRRDCEFTLSHVSSGENILRSADC